MERAYNIIEPSLIRKTKVQKAKEYSKIIIEEVLKACASGLIFYGLNYLYNYFSNKDKLDEDDRNILTGTSCLAGILGFTCLYLIGRVYFGQNRIYDQNLQLGFSNMQLADCVQHKSAMLYAVKEYYQGKIGIEAIESVYRSKTLKPFQLKEGCINRVLEKIRPDNIDEYSIELASQYICFRKKFLETELLKEFKSELINPYKFSGWLIPNLIVSITAPMQATAALKIAECVISSLRNISTRNEDYKYTKAVEKTLGQTRIDYEQFIEPHLGIPFEKAYEDENYAFVDYMKILDFFGQDIKVSWWTLENNDSYEPAKSNSILQLMNNGVIEWNRFSVNRLNRNDS